MPKVSGVFLFALLLAWPWQTAVAADPCASGKLGKVIVAAGDTLVLHWVGTVSGKMAQSIEHAFDAHKRRVKSVELSLHSCGGGVDNMAATLGVLRHIKETHQLATRVEPGATCASACIPVFLAGERRVAANSSLWFFHRSWRHMLSGGVDRVETAAIGRSSLELFLEQYYAPAGVSREWLEHLRGIIENGSGYWQTGRDLWEAKSGISTETIGDVQPQEDRTIHLAPAPGCTAICRG